MSQRLKITRTRSRATQKKLADFKSTQKESSKEKLAKHHEDVVGLYQAAMEAKILYESALSKYEDLMKEAGLTEFNNDGLFEFVQTKKGGTAKNEIPPKDLHDYLKDPEKFFACVSVVQKKCDAYLSKSAINDLKQPAGFTDVTHKWEFRQRKLKK